MQHIKIAFITIGIGIALFIGLIALAIIAAFFKAVRDINKFTKNK